MSKVVIVGGGAAGMMAAISAAQAGHKVTLFEKNEKLGKKIYITGKGRCNVTNDSDVESLLSHVTRNPKFLYSAFYTWDSFLMQDFLEKEGLSLKTERGNRVFPASDHSSDVIRTLYSAMKKRGVTIYLHTEVKKILCKEGTCYGVCVSRDHKLEEILADAVIVATGGISYPSTGSTGDGYRFAQESGHIVVEVCIYFIAQVWLPLLDSNQRPFG